MKNYEISVWEDIHEGNLLKEKKIAIIGSDSMTSEARAFSPQLTRNINGTHTFTFKMYYVCNDFAVEGMEQGFKKYTNPFISLMSNERKIKLKYNNKWYDFIIKNCQEDSNGKSITYTCKDLFINELGKTGFSLEFDNELLNNSGTISELTEKILEGTDWRIASDQDIILQEHNEPVYESANITGSFTGYKDGTNDTFSFISGKNILLFQSCVPTLKDGVIEGGVNICQFLFNNNSGWQTEQNQMLVINAYSYSTLEGSWRISGNNFVFKVGNTDIIQLPCVSIVSSQYRGTRLVKSQKTAIDKVLNRSVNVYTDNGSPAKTYYEYAATEFTKPTTVNNLFINYENFLGTEGWISNKEIYTKLYPLISDWSGQGEYEASSYLYIPSNSNNLNLGLQESYMNFPEGFVKGEKYIFRFKIKSNSSESPGSYITSHTINPKVASYDIDNPTTAITSYFSFSPISGASNNWIEYTAICTKSISKRDIITSFIENIDGTNKNCKLGLFFNNGNTSCWLEKIEFYRYVEGLYSNETTPRRIDPGSLGTKSIGQIVYKYYDPSQTYSKETDIVYAYSDTTKWNQVYPVYNSNPFEEVRAIKAKNSNRFNLLQSLAETFECWCDFIIEHNEDGSIKFDNNNKVQKFVKFKREIGQNSGLCFTYGLDLKSISRTIASEQIATKTIVPINSNSYGEDGFCSIGRCKENYPRVNYILNFDYYITHGMINQHELYNDLYSSVSTDIGYYYKLHNWNIEYDEKSELKIKRQSELTEQLAYQQTYSEAIEATSQEITTLQNELFAFCSVSTMAQVKEYASTYPSTKLQSKLNAYNTAKKSYTNYQTMYNDLTSNITSLTTEINTINTRLDTIKQAIIELDEQFYAKYSRFIQEGSWTSEDYYDDLQYYLDAVNVAFTSSKPQISYNINVMRLSEIEEFKNRKFELGDICYIQDTEFFGYVAGDSFTPYREKVLISEVVENLDDPTQSTFKVQNYKTQFEDLFQRITATTQSLQYSEGSYAKAASVVTENRTIDADVIQNSIAANENLVIQAQNESILQDNTGITLVDSTNPNYRLKLTSKGVFVTTGDGWRSAIRGDGIVADALSAGMINTNKIVVSDGNFTAFRWDSAGINAYEQLYTSGENPQKAGINLGTFIRFDHFGLYGIKDYSGTFAPTSETDIWNSAHFGLTWKGFFLKNKNGGGLFEISNENDLLVKDGSSNNRIQIGRISGNGTQEFPYIYGIKIYDASGARVMETSDNGDLWIRNMLSIGDTNRNAPYAKLGPDSTDNHNTNYRRVFGAGLTTGGSTYPFKVYEDGWFEATGGKIGNLYISQIDGSKIAKITSTTNIFTGDLPSNAILTVSLTNETIITDRFIWKKNGNIISEQTGYQLTILPSDIGNIPSTATYSVSFTHNNIPYSATIVVDRIPSGSTESNFYSIRTNELQILKTVLNNGGINLSNKELSYKFIKSGDIITNPVYKINLIFPSGVSQTNSGVTSVVYEIKDILTKFNEIATMATTREYSDGYIYLDQNNNQYYYSLGKLTNNNFGLNTNLDKIQKAILYDNVYWQFELIENNKIMHTYTVPIIFGVTNSLAEFGIYSSNIIASIASTKATFDLYGLHIKNGGFEIINNANEQVLSADENGNLKITGEIIATSGSFNGSVTAKEGTIGGFKIDESSLSSLDGTLQLISGASGSNVGITATAGKIGGFIIDGSILKSDDNEIQLIGGTSSKIIAKSIDLGENANITNYLKLGDAYIKNPNIYSHLFIESGNIKLYDDGRLDLGNISVNGTTSTISGNSWSITPNKAIFNNVEVSGVIHTSLFEHKSIQSVGGSMLFKTSIQIESGDSININVSNTNDISLINIGDYIYFTGESQSAIYIVKSKNNNSFTIKNKSSNDDVILGSGYSIATILANTENNELTNNLIIGVNSTNSRSAFLYPKGFTFVAPTSYNTGSDISVLDSPSLFLGDLSSIAEQVGITLNNSAYGLYGDNVFLKGTLTTRVGNSSYAGINTLSGAQSTKSGIINDKIVFWAGSADASINAIQNAVFQVTESGYIYGSNAYLTGTIIANSYIQAAELYTPKIYGGTNSESSALEIYSTNSGIEFYDLRQNGVLVLAIKNKEFQSANRTFINLDTTIDFNGDSATLKKLYINKSNNDKIDLKIYNGRISAYSINEQVENDLSYIDLDNNHIDINNKLVIEDAAIKEKIGNMVINKTLQIGDINNKGKITYQQVDNGYDLYVEVNN